MRPVARVKFGRFDRLVIFLLILLAAGLGGAAWLSSLLGLRPPSLSAQEIGVLGPVGLVFDQKMATASVESRWQNSLKVAGRTDHGVHALLVAGREGAQRVLGARVGGEGDRRRAAAELGRRDGMDASGIQNSVLVGHEIPEARGRRHDLP